MKSEIAGKSILEVEVTQIDKQGVWLLLGDREYFLSFEEFPRFRNATIDEIHNVSLTDDVELRWPNLDINLAVESLGKSHHVPSIG